MATKEKVTKADVFRVAEDALTQIDKGPAIGLGMVAPRTDPGADTMENEGGNAAAPVDRTDIADAPGAIGVDGGGTVPSADAPPVGSAPTDTDPWNDYEEIEYQDDDLGEKYKIRAPKSYAQKVKDGYARRSVMDRNARYLNQARSTLEPLITSGDWARIEPFIQMGLSDQQFAEALGELYSRRVNGRPLSFADEMRQAEALTKTAEAGGGATDDADYNDPLYGKFLQRIDQKFGTIEQKFAAQEQAAQAVQQQNYQRQQQAQAAQHTAQRVYQTAWNNLRSQFPNDFTGVPENDRPKISKIHNYAMSAGLLNNTSTAQEAILAYDVAALRLAQAGGFGTGTQAPVASPAADAIRQNDAAQAAARAAAARSAAAAASGGGNMRPAGDAPSPEERLKKVATKTKDGSARKPRDVVRDAMKVFQ